MTAQRKFQRKFQQIETMSAGAALFGGEATGMFSSGSAPVARSEALGGDLVEMFSSGSAPALYGDAAAGEGTRMFSSGS